ncbi:MAG: M15 family metallopeptidase [Egibacteraceae bacterium]
MPTLLSRLRTYRISLLIAAGLVFVMGVPAAAQPPTSHVLGPRRDPGAVTGSDDASGFPASLLERLFGERLGQPAEATQGTDGAGPRSGTLLPPSAAPGTHATFAKVRAQRPQIRVSGLSGRGNLQRIREVDGVRRVAAVAIARMSITDRPAKVAAVRPWQFRPFTPQVTADEVGVWQRLIEGDAAFTHDVATKLNAQLGATVAAGRRPAALRVGAYASNGVPAVADVVISRPTARRLRLDGRQIVLLTVASGRDPAVVAAAIERATGGQAKVLDAPQQQRAFLTGADAQAAFEPFDYVDLGDGMIQIDADWVRRNIVTRRVPILLGTVTCHRLMVDQLAGALGEVEQRGLAHLIDVNDYGGCWVPRHIDFDPADPISMHAWGLAADFNVQTNGLGRTPTMDPRIVQIFDRWGFNWGGRWSRPDGMHFELGALMSSPKG